MDQTWKDGEFEGVLERVPTAQVQDEEVPTPKVKNGRLPQK